MAKIAPYVFVQEFDNNGEVLNGGKIYTYEAGTSTPKTTYTDSTEASANTNPIILDASGRADIWLGTGSYKFVITDSADVTIKTVDAITGDAVNVFGQSVESISGNETVTTSDENTVYLCTAALTISLPAVASAQEGFIIGVKNTTSGDTVTIDPDGLELIDSASTATIEGGQSAIILCDGSEWQTLFLNDFTDDDNTFSGNNTFSGDNTFSGENTFTDTVENDALVIWAKGADVASATALTLGTDGNFFDITGTTSITSINTLGVGTQVKLQFDDALTLTHNATDLILPSGANITTAAGDVVEFVEYATGDWICSNYTKADGTAVVQNELILDTSQATTSGTEFDFTGIPSGTKLIRVILDGTSLSGSDDLLVQIGDSGGFETTGYTSRTTTDGGGGTTSTSGYVIDLSNGTRIYSGFTLTICLEDGSTNTWIASGLGGHDANIVWAAGRKDLSGELDRVRFTRTGTNTFDAGSVNIQYE